MTIIALKECYLDLAYVWKVVIQRGKDVDGLPAVCTVVHFVDGCTDSLGRPIGAESYYGDDAERIDLLYAELALGGRARPLNKPRPTLSLLRDTAETEVCRS